MNNQLNCCGKLLQIKLAVWWCILFKVTNSSGQNVQKYHELLTTQPSECCFIILIQQNTANGCSGLRPTYTP